MKVLWFIPIPPKQAFVRGGKTPEGTGFWIHSLIDELARRKSLELGVCYVGLGGETPFTFEGVSYFPIESRKMATVVRNSRDMDVLLGHAANIVRDFRPDLIHVHGTEGPFGLLRTRGLTQIRTVVSIQGLMSACAKWAWGDKSFLDVLGIQRLQDLRSRFATLKIRKSYLSRIAREVEIICGVDGIIGRSDWDRAHVKTLAPKQEYFHVDELMRPEFFGANWNIDGSIGNRIFASGRVDFLKGIHVLLESFVQMRKNTSEDITLRIAGKRPANAISRHLDRYLQRHGLSDAVEFTGWLAGPEIIRELMECRVYVVPSFIENGCNGLQEAMLLGVPSVATFTGGMCTTLKHGETGLMFPSGDRSLLASCIQRLMCDSQLAVELGKNAQEVALARHDPDKIVRELMISYSA